MSIIVILLALAVIVKSSEEVSELNLWRRQSHTGFFQLESYLTVTTDPVSDGFS